MNEIEQEQTNVKKLEKGEYIYAVGRRKTATAQVRIYKASKASFEINEMDINEYLKTDTQRAIVISPFKISELDQNFKVTAMVSGGGLHSQAEAIRLGIARALVTYNLGLRPELKKSGYLKRDPRVKERKKFGLRGARRAPQWSKR